MHPIVSSFSLFLIQSCSFLNPLCAMASNSIDPFISEPVGDPNELYPKVVGLPEHKHFMLGKHKLNEDERKQTLDVVHDYLQKQKSHFLGYQVNQNLDFAKDMAPYLDMHVNNIGDPFTSGNLTTNSKFMERAVLDYYAQLWNARWPHDPNDAETYWGFCLTMGSTEGNLYGMWNARDYLSGVYLIWDNNMRIVTRQARSLMRDEAAANAFTPVAFYSSETHYSFAKAMRMLDIRTFSAIGRERYPDDCPLEGTWPDEVPSKDGEFGEGSIDIDALATLVEFFAARGYPILVSFNYGTTFKGAYDDVKAAGERLLPILEKYNLLERELQLDPNDPTKISKRTGYWFHVDGALGAAYMPFVEMAHDMDLITTKGPEFDFRLHFVHSIAMSGHKWPGAPMPCGVYMTRSKYQIEPPSRPEYIGTPDTTFAGSRNGLSVMLMWHRLSSQSYFDQILKVLHDELMAKYTEHRLKELASEIQKDLYVGRTGLALTVRFRRANDDIVTKYSLSNEILQGVDPETGEVETRHYSHVFLMEHVTESLIDELIEDLKAEDAFPEMEADSSRIEPAEPMVSGIDFVPLQGRGFRG